MGERLVRNEEVRGSIPLSSTTVPRKKRATETRMSWLLAEEILDSISVFAAVISAWYWLKSARVSLADAVTDSRVPASLNGRAAATAAVAAALQALAVMTHVFQLAS